MVIIDDSQAKLKLSKNLRYSLDIFCGSYDIPHLVSVTPLPPYSFPKGMFPKPSQERRKERDKREREREMVEIMGRITRHCLEFLTQLLPEPCASFLAMAKLFSNYEG